MPSIYRQTLRQWAGRGTLLAAALGLLIAPAALAGPVSGNNPPQGENSAGYTDKSALKNAGRAAITSGRYQVTQSNVVNPNGTDYYVDSIQGDDSHLGTSPSQAWKSLEKVNSTTFQAGDRILLKAGSVWQASGNTTAREAYEYTEWNGQQRIDAVAPGGARPSAMLAPKGSGSSSKPIILSSYGTGNAPQLKGNGVVNDVVQLTNQSSWEISNLDISNVKANFDASHFSPASGNGQTPGTENPDTGDLRGLHIQAASAGQLNGYNVHHLFVHDVAGVTWSVSKAGVDRSKRTGGILFEGLKGDQQTPSTFTHINVHDNIIANTSFANIVFKQFSGMGTARYQDKSPGWGDRAVASSDNQGNIQEDPNWKPHEHVTICGNYLTNRDTQYGWDGMYITSVRAASVFNNLIDGAGVSGIEMYWADNIHVYNNEVGDLASRVGAADSNGIDPDRGTSNILIEVNYVHDSGEGILLCGFSFGSAIVRYNIITNIGRNYINPHGDSGINLVYNNLMYNTQEPGPANADRKVHFFASSGSTSAVYKERNKHYAMNNVFINTFAGALGTLFQDNEPGVSFSHNSYYGPAMSIPQTDQQAITIDPELKGDPSLDIAKAAIGQPTSPLILSSTPVNLTVLAPGFSTSGDSSDDQLPVTSDFFGLPMTRPASVGVSSYEPPAGQSLITGYVVDQSGQPVPAATVHYGQTSVTADEHGRYLIQGPVGQYTIFASAQHYQNGNPTNVDTTTAHTCRQDVSLGSVTVQTGTIVGLVSTNGQGLAGAAIQLIDAQGQVIASTSSDAAGHYQLADAPTGADCSLRASLDGYRSGKKDGVQVNPARTTQVDFVLSKIARYESIIDENFDREATGAFSGTNDGVLGTTATAPVGSISIEDNANQPGNKYLHINKTSGSKGTLAVFNTIPQRLKGTVTIEARVQRTSSNGAPNQAALYSYGEDDWNSTDPAASRNPSATFGFSGNTIITHNVTGASSTTNAGHFQANTWYTIRNVANYDTGTFDLYVDNMNEPVLSKQPLRNLLRGKSLDYFSIFINGSNKGDWMVDYLKVGKGEPAHTNVTSLELVELNAKDQILQLTPSADEEELHMSVSNPFTTAAAVSVQPTDAGAHVNIQGQESTGPISLELDHSAAPADAVNTTRVPIVVTARDGTRKEYQLIIEQTNPAQLTYLEHLEVANYQLFPAFKYDRQGQDTPYELPQTLPHSVTTVTISWKRGWGGQSLQLNGKTVNADEQTVNLQDGNNVITVVADSFTGDFGTYLINITRESAPKGDNDNQPSQPEQPIQPGEPEKPDQPDQPSRPEQPIVPTEPSQPEQPTQPNQPGKTEQPNKPIQPGKPEQTEQPEQSKQPSTPQNENHHHDEKDHLTTAPIGEDNHGQPGYSQRSPASVGATNADGQQVNQTGTLAKSGVNISPAVLAVLVLIFSSITAASISVYSRKHRR
ncbi:hypothetical protein KIM372_05080 [Bombiscardovia nodaiensis]|uniref:Cadherin-like beta-sandwich-like domain-containing protein n=1 Tax=Bombiscardovia nodaiensis TaxID=2932181 RepID=A0ABN6S8U0_9BIFI|nr:hypothetical protein KIM372_05080 [Bombiscardovia nodaiensis]